VWVKICGVTNEADAQMVAACGADALGVNLYAGSKRHVTPGESCGWLPGLAGKVLRVAVVVDPGPGLLAEIRDSGCFDAVQFHGDEDPEMCAGARFPVWIKATRARDDTSFASALRFPTEWLLLDSYKPGAFGGTGHRLDWRQARSFVNANPDRKVILAGGLDTANVAEAIRIVAPFGVDVASGVEATPREKEEYLVREFIRAARGLPVE
jgi:phosphoribosylanthranilate isomerase